MKKALRRPELWKIGTAVVAGLAGKELLARAREADLTGQVALVTGGSRGLGIAIARELAAAGCRLAICARNTEELEFAASELRANGTEVVAITCDVVNEDEVNAMVEEVLAHYGQIDLLFTVAGIIEIGPVETHTIAHYRQAMDVMFWGTLYPIMAVLPGMRARRSGRIATITSIGGRLSVPHLLPYSAAKFAATGLSEGLAAELANDGIKVTTVIPGLMRTGGHLQAQFAGSDRQQHQDYVWFALGGTSPLVPDAARSARIIVRAVRRGDPVCTFSLPFSLASRFHGLAPATTVRLMRLADALLPSHTADQPEPTSPGKALDPSIDLPGFRFATTLGRKAAHSFNQHAGDDPPATPTDQEPDSAP